MKSNCTPTKRYSAHMRIEAAQTLLVQTPRGAQLAATRIACDRPGHGMTAPHPREDAYLVSLQLRDLPGLRLWRNGRPVQTGTFANGSLAIYDLREAWRADLSSPFDMLHFQLPRASLDEACGRAGSRRAAMLEFQPGQSLPDPVASRLGLALLPALRRPEQASSIFVDHVALALHAHIVQRYGGARPTPAATGGLAPWQERRVKEVIRANLADNIPLARLAAECGLSLSHFARAFKQCTGMPPHRWLLEQRVERTRELLRETAMPLAEIALSCGFADQSHFNRVFARSTGTSPGAWRRSHRSQFQAAPLLPASDRIQLPA